MSSPTLDLDRASSARNAAPDPSVSANRAGRSPRRPRRSGVSAGRVVAFLVLLAAVAAGAWFALRPGKAPDASKSASGQAGEVLPGGGLSDVPAEYRPIVEYLRPSEAEVKLWMDSVLASSYVHEKWEELAGGVSLVYDPRDNTVNAFAFYDQEQAGRPSIALCGGEVRLSRLVGALALVRSSAEAQGVEKDIKTYLQRVSVVVAGMGELSEQTVIDLLNEFEVGTAVFQDVGAVSAAKGVADGICKAALAHEFGHLAGGHPRGADLNRTVSQNEERQADLFASSVAASVSNGQQMLGGQILSWYTLALAETINPTNELFRSHPYSADRLRAAVEANKSLAASLGITVADVDRLVAELSGDGDDEGETETADASQTSESVDYDAGTSGVVEESLVSVAAVLGSAKTNGVGVLSVEMPPDDAEMLPTNPQGKNLVSPGGLYTEIGAVVRMSMFPNADFQLHLDLVRVAFGNGGLVLTTGSGGSSAYASEGTVRIGAHRYASFAEKTGAGRVFFSENGEMLAVQNLMMGSIVVFYDKGDTRRRRASVGLSAGVSFPNVDNVVQWSISRPVSIDLGALSSVRFGGGGARAGSGSPDCPVCHGLGYVKRPAGASYGQSAGNNWISVPCPVPSCRAGR